MYSCLTECPTIPQKTIPLATPMETVLVPGRKRESCKAKGKGNEQTDSGEGGDMMMNGAGREGKDFNK